MPEDDPAVVAEASADKGVVIEYILQQKKDIERQTAEWRAQQADDDATAAGVTARGDGSVSAALKSSKGHGPGVVAELMAAVERRALGRTMVSTTPPKPQRLASKWSANNLKLRLLN